jgi:hypothetical protein
MEGFIELWLVLQKELQSLANFNSMNLFIGLMTLFR